MEVQLTEHIAKLETEVTALTDGSEEALRGVIDCRAELEDEKYVLKEVQDRVRAQQPRPERPQPKRKVPKRRDSASDADDHDDEAVEDEDEDMPDAEDEVPLEGIVDMLKTARESKANEYEALSAYQRYGLNNDYISFKKVWHDAQHPEDQIPLPDATTWFDELGRPRKGVVSAADEDEELVIEREIIDLKCPLSLQIMKEPYGNRKCRHVFEKSAILDFLSSNGGQANCPVCSEVRIHS
jgi:E3 SUMO-protein ligase NSE2